MENKTKRFLSLVFALVMVMSIIVPQMTFGASAAATYEKATSIAVGDTVVIAYETGKKELGSIDSYGTGVSYTAAPTGENPLTVVNGSSSGTVAFQTSDGKYLQWSNKNNLYVKDALNANSSWNVTFEDGNAIIKNAADSTRVLQWNASSPRFACYQASSKQLSIQLYKLTEGTGGSEEPCTHPEHDQDGTCKTCPETVEHEYVNGICSCGATETVAPYKKATTIAAGDKVVLVYETGKQELSAISTTSTKYGIGTAYTNAPAGLYELTVEAGTETGTFAFKTSDNKYLTWTSGNSLNVNATKSANTSWNVTFSGGNAVIVNAADATRTIRWNTGSPRFACYNQGQSDVQLYKLDVNSSCAHDYAGVVTAPTCTTGGYTTYTCSKCGDSYTGNETSATGIHTFENGICTGCALPEDPKAIVDAAYELEAGKELPYDATLTGKITAIDTAYSDQYKNITVTIAVEGKEDKPVMCYRLAGEGADALAPYDVITVTGKLMNYKGTTIEFAQGCTLDNVVKHTHTYAPETGLCECGAKEAPKSDAIAAYTSATTIWGETWSNARESYAIKVLDASGNVMGTTTLNTKLDVSMDGDVKVSWHITLPGNADADAYWIQKWTITPTLDNMPAKVELWIDGVKTSESAIQLNGPDGINKIVAAIAGADGKLTSYATTFAAALDAAKSGDTIELLADVTENAVITQNISINTGAFKVNGTVKVTNGATLTVAEGETLTVSDYLLVGNDKYFANLENAGNGGKLVVNGTVDAQQVNADNGGEIAVNGIMRVINTVAVENGEMENAVPGKLTVSENGKIETKFLNVFAGATVTVDGAVELLEHETDQQQLRVFGGATVTVNGSLSSDRSASVDTGSTLNVNGGELTVGGTLTNNGTVTVSGESTLNIPTLSGTELKLLHGAIIKDSTVGGEAMLYGKVIFRGDNTFTMIYDYGNAHSEEYAEWIVEKGAALTLTETARYGLGYGDKATIYGEIEDALTARENLTEDDISVFMHGLVAMSNWDVENSLTVKDSYVTIGSNNSFGNSPKASHVGTFNILFENAVLDASRITFYEAPSKTNFDFVNSDVKIGTFMTRDADSKFTLTNTKLLSTATTNGTDEGNYNAGKLTLVNSSLTYNAPVTNTGKINLDATSCLAAPSITGTGTITIDATGLTGKAVKVIDLNGGEAPEVSVTNGEGVTVVTCADGDVILSNADMSAIYVDSAYTGEIGKEVAEGLYMGINAFDNINDAAAAAEKAATKLVINSASKYTTHQYYFLNTVIDAENKRFDYVADASVTYDVDANAPFTAYQILINNAELNVPVTGNLRSSEALRIMGGKIAVQGNRAENAEAPTNIFTGSWGGGVTATDDTQVSAGYLQLNQKTAATFDDTVILVTAGIFTVDDATVVLDNAYLYIGNCGTYTPAVLTVANGGKLALTNNASIVKDNSFDANMTVGADAELSLDISSKLVIDTLTVAEGGTVIIDATGIEEDKTIKVIDLNGTESLKGKVTVNNLPAGTTVVYGDDGDVTLTRATAVATIGEDRYFTLQAAVDAADDGDTITMIDNITEELVTINKAVTLNGNGYTLTGNVNLNGASLTDCTIRGQVIADGEVTLAGSNDISRLWITGDNAVTTIPEGATLTVETPYPGILIVGATETDGLAKNYFTTTSTKGGKLIVNGTLNGEAVGVFGNGELVVGGEINTPELYTGKDATDTTSTAGKVTIAESGALQTIFCGLGGETNVAGTLTVKGASGEHNFDAVMTVKSGAVLNVTGELVSNRGIAVEENATVNVDSGAVEFKDLNGNDSKFSGKLTNNGDINADITSSVIASSIVGDGNITIDATGLTGKATVINLSGTESLEGKVTFVGDVVATYGADGDVTIEKAVATIGEQGYASLQAAINAAADRDTVKLLADIDLGEATLVIDKAITLDTNDHKLTAQVVLAHEDAKFVADESMKESVSTSVTDKKVGYDNAAGIYSVVNFTVAGSNVTLGNDLALNFWVRKADLSGTGYTAEIIKGNTVEYVAMNEWTTVYDDDGVEYHQIPFGGMAAKEMNDEVSVQIFKDGKAISNKFTDSVVEYAKFMFANSNDKELHTMLVDMLNYGAAAQKAFNYNTDNLANSILSEEQKKVPAANTDDMADKWNGGKIGYGSNLELKDNIILHIWFRNANVTKAVISYTDHSGKTVEVSTSSFEDRLPGISSVAVDTLVVADGNQTITVDFYSGDTKVGTVTESIESYLKYMLEKDGGNELYNATAKFVASSYDLFH